MVQLTIWRALYKSDFPHGRVVVTVCRVLIASIAYGQNIRADMRTRRGDSAVVWVADTARRKAVTAGVEVWGACVRVCLSFFFSQLILTRGHV